MTVEQIRQARDLLTLPGNSVSSIARLLGVSRSTIYKYLPELALQIPAGTRGRALPGRQADPAASLRAPSPAGHHGTADRPLSCRVRL